jgi:hypothetical protein
MSKSPEAPIKFSPNTVPQDVVDDILEMREDGLSYTNIAWLLGITWSCVRYVCNRDKINEYNRDRWSDGVGRKKKLRGMRTYYKSNRK